MNLNKIQSIKFALMKKEKDIDASKADFTIYASVSFQMSKNTDVTPELFEEFIESMYVDLTKTELMHINDSLGLWVEYDNKNYENAISLDTLDIIKKHSSADVKAIYEFFKMTLADVQSVYNFSPESLINKIKN